MARASASQRDRAAEGRVWPVVAALVISTLLGTVVGWWLLSRGSDSKSSFRALSNGVEQQRDASPSPPSPISEARQQLLNRLRALQIDRGEPSVNPHSQLPSNKTKRVNRCMQAATGSYQPLTITPIHFCSNFKSCSFTLDEFD